jgi:beta-lactamase class A
MKFFKLNLPLYIVVLLACGAFASGKYILSGKKSPEPTSTVNVPNCPASMEQIRLKDYELTHPLILTDISEESAALRGIHNKIESYVNTARTEQRADEISVYFRKLDNGAWFSINPNQTYNPASMIKIAYLITYMKMAESNPGILNKKIFYKKRFSQTINQNIKDFKLKEGVNYTIEGLLTAMIVHSDNDATLLLSENMNVNIFNGIFKDLDIPVPNPVTEYFISVNDFCKFFRVLYSSTYTRPEYSEYALKMMTHSSYNDGLRKGIDADVKIAHKFGERVFGNKSQLHEFGIVFYNKTPYLIGVMTKGNSLPQLSTIIADISKIAFDEYKQQAL